MELDMYGYQHHSACIERQACISARGRPHVWPRTSGIQYSYSCSRCYLSYMHLISCVSTNHFHSYRHFRDCLGPTMIRYIVSQSDACWHFDRNHVCHLTTSQHFSANQHNKITCQSDVSIQMIIRCCCDYKDVYIFGWTSTADKPTSNNLS